MFSKKATIIDEIFTVDLTLCSKCQIDGEDFIDFCGLLRKQELYYMYIEISGLFVTKNKTLGNKQTCAFIRNLRVLTFGGDLLRRSHVMHHGNPKVHRKQDLSDSKGQFISKCLLGVIVLTKIPMKIL